MSRSRRRAPTRRGLRCDVVTLYAGGMYHSTRTKVHGRPPRLRARGGHRFLRRRPRQLHLPPLRLRPRDLPGLRERQPRPAEGLPELERPGARRTGDTVFVSGNPARTERMDTLAQLRGLRDVAYPYNMARPAQEHGAPRRLRQGERRAEARGRARPFGIDNSRKAYRGLLGGLRDPALMRKKADEEAALRTAIGRTRRSRPSTAPYGTTSRRWKRRARRSTQVTRRSSVVPTRSPAVPHRARSGAPSRTSSRSRTPSVCASTATRTWTRSSCRSSRRRRSTSASRRSSGARGSSAWRRTLAPKTPR